MSTIADSSSSSHSSIALRWRSIEASIPSGIASPFATQYSASDASISCQAEIGAGSAAGSDGMPVPSVPVPIASPPSSVRSARLHLDLALDPEALEECHHPVINPPVAVRPFEVGRDALRPDEAGHRPVRPELRLAAFLLREDGETLLARPVDRPPEGVEPADERPRGMHPAAAPGRHENASAALVGPERRPAVVGIALEELRRAYPQEARHPQDLVGTGADDLAGAAAAARPAGKGEGAFPVEKEIQRRGFSACPGSSPGSAASRRSGRA